MTDQPETWAATDLGAENAEIIGEGFDAVSAAPEPCPVHIAAKVMLERFLTDENARRQVLPRHAAAVVVGVDSDWLEPIARVWSEVMHRIVAMSSEACRAARDADRPLMEIRVGSGSKKSPDSETAGIARALSRGTQVVGLAARPARHLPDALLRVAEARVTVPRPDGETLVEAVYRYLGCRPTVMPSSAEARVISPDDLLLARRPERDPDAYIRRALALAAARSRPPADGPRLEDLQGMRQAVEWALALQADLALYRRGDLSWSDLDKGVLLAGPSGTGKTTFARALAASCGLPLVIGSLGAWQAAGHLGDLLKAMRATFDRARADAPCILLLDEIDGIGDRATYDARHRDYSVQVANALLELLDGAEGREGVIVVGATNRPEAIDPALLRAGRLDRVIEIELPDAGALAGIMRHHLRKDLAEVDLTSLAQACVGITGADVERAVRGMRRRARQATRPAQLPDLEAELLGPLKPLSDHTLWRVAVHEAGHGVAIAVSHPGALHAVSVPRRSAMPGRLGVATAEIGDGKIDAAPPLTREALVRLVALRLAGRAAEQLILGSPSAGAGGSVGSDLAQATWTAAVGVGSLGLAGDARVPVWCGRPTPAEVPGLLARHPALYRQVRALLDEAQEAATAILTTHRASLIAVAQALLDREQLSGREVEMIIASHGPPGSPVPGQERAAS